MHVIVATPGRLLDLTEKGIANVHNCQILVLDEVSSEEASAPLKVLHTYPVPFDVIALLHNNCPLKAPFPHSMLPTCAHSMIECLLFGARCSLVDHRCVATLVVDVIFIMCERMSGNLNVSDRTTRFKNTLQCVEEEDIVWMVRNLRQCLFPGTEWYF